MKKYYALGATVYIGEEKFTLQEIDVTDRYEYFKLKDDDGIYHWFPEYIPLTLRPYTIPGECFEPPVPDFKVDEKVMVRNSENEGWRKRFFCKVIDKAKPFVCWLDGGHSWTTGSGEAFKYCRYPTPEELGETE